MPRWGGRWSPSSLINTLGCSTHMHVGRQSVSQSVSSSVSQSVRQPASQSVTLVLFTIITTTRTRCNTICFFLAVCPAVTTFFLSRV